MMVLKFIKISSRWLLECGAEILVDFSKIIAIVFTRTLKFWNFLWIYLRSNFMPVLTFTNIKMLLDQPKY